MRQTSTSTARPVDVARAMTTRESNDLLRADGWLRAGRDDWIHPTLAEVARSGGALHLPDGVTASYTRRAAVLTALHAARRERWSDDLGAWAPIPAGEPKYPHAVDAN